MALTDIKKLGDPILYEVAAFIEKDEVINLLPYINKMWDLILEFRKVYGRGRAIAAPQIGISKRIICLNIQYPEVLINPVFEYKSGEMIELWDDCMSFPNLMVWVKRHKRITISFYDINWEKQKWELENDMSELLQHEIDHLNGILAIERGKDLRCLKWVD
jgi:peptide deformylase